METTSQQGLVLRIDAKQCHVEIDGEQTTLPLAGKLFEQQSHEKRPVAVGDYVIIREQDGARVIDAVLPRKTKLQRRASSESGRQRAQVIAANISQVMVVASLAEPPFQPELVDAVLAAAAREEIAATLVMTKLDRDRKGRGAQWIQLYRDLGYTVIATSTAEDQETPEAFDEVARHLRENRSVLCGLSGVGKSTLLNRVVPELDVRVGSLNHIRQGKHTTAYTQLIALPGGGHVLDTPGIRSFHLFHTGSQEIQFFFREIGVRLPECEYRNCLHLDEPNCAVKQALKAKAIAKSRYRSYSKMVRAALEAESRTSDQPPSGGAADRTTKPTPHP